MIQALKGIKVLDVSQVAAVPMAARHLADFGADVVHIENPESGDSWRYFQAGQGPGDNGVPSRINYNWENYNRNKRSMTLNLNQKTGREILYNMAKRADVLLTNLRPYERTKYRLSYNILKKFNQRIIYGSLSGYGIKGLDKNLPAYDITAYWYRSGMCDILSTPPFPQPDFRPAFGDNLAALAIAYGVMMALYVREKTGEGQEIDVALMHSGLYQVSFDVAGVLATGLSPTEWRPQLPIDLAEKAEKLSAETYSYINSQTMNPLANAYLTKDKKILLFIMLQPDRYWERFCQVLEKTELINDPRFTSFDLRSQNRMALIEILEEVIATKTQEEWIPLLKDIPHAPYRTIEDAINDPQCEINNFFVTYEHPIYGKIRGVSNPVRMSKTPSRLRMPAPEFGQHTEEVLLEYGYTWDEIAKLKQNKTIA